MRQLEAGSGNARSRRLGGLLLQHLYPAGRAYSAANGSPVAPPTFLQQGGGGA